MEIRKRKADKEAVQLKRKVTLFIITAAFLTGVGACGNGNTTSSSAAASNENSTGTENTEGFTFADLAKYQFEFCSGAGGWSTDFTIDSDGHFSGEYHDSDFGDAGDGYENGTVYTSVFDGHFKDLTQVNDHCYRMTLADISYQENEFGKEEIKDGTKYVYSDAYGLTGTDTFLVYLEGTPVSEISEEVYYWLSMANDSDTELTMVALVNEGQEEGIYSYKRMSPLEDAQTTFESYKSSYEYWTDEIDKAESQSEINDDSQKRYEVMDECLNYIWNLIKNDTDENAYQKILEEQRTWIADKEAKAKAASDEYGDGSAGTAAYYDKSAELTMTRCEELIEYLK